MSTRTGVSGISTFSRTPPIGVPVSAGPNASCRASTVVLPLPQKAAAAATGISEKGISPLPLPATST